MPFTRGGIRRSIYVIIRHLQESEYEVLMPFTRGGIRSSNVIYESRKFGIRSSYVLDEKPICLLTFSFVVSSHGKRRSGSVGTASDSVIGERRRGGLVGLSPSRAVATCSPRRCWHMSLQGSRNASKLFELWPRSQAYRREVRADGQKDERTEGRTDGRTNVEGPG